MNKYTRNYTYNFICVFFYKCAIKTGKLKQMHFTAEVTTLLFLPHSRKMG